MTTITSRLGADGVTLAYGGAPISRDLTVQIPDNEFTAVSYTHLTLPTTPYV